MKKLISAIIIVALLIPAVPTIGIYAGIFNLSKENQERINELPWNQKEFWISESNISLGNIKDRFPGKEELKEKLPTQITAKLELFQQEKEAEINNPKEAGQYVKGEMIKRKEHIEFTYKPDYKFDGNANQFWSDLQQHIFEITDSPKDGHYLLYNYKQFNLNMEGTTNEVLVKLDFKYHSTAEEEAAVDKRVDQILDELNIENKSDYEKAKAIYDYIKKATTYSKTEDMYSAYGTLIDHQSVCNGYALAFYRLGKQAGLDVVCISGRGHNEPHLWNAVKLNGQYYLCDVTWDSQTGSYMYFLKGKSDFDDHYADGRNDREIINNLAYKNYR